MLNSAAPTKTHLPMLQTLLAVVLVAAGNAFAQAQPIAIGLDAEFGQRTATSARAVQQGMEIAIDEINAAGGVLGGRKLTLVTRDNRGVSAIGVDNLRDLAKDPNVVAVFGGKFSPIYIEALPVAHDLGIPLMNPWGSADGITDHNFKPNFSFRLSLKDAWAAPAFIRYAQERYKATRVGLLLPNTAWGRSNYSALAKAAGAAGVTVVGYRWYNWGDKSLATPYGELHAAGAQVLILVANEVEGAILVKEMASLPENKRLPVVSHWGITGGEFAAMTGDALHAIDLSVIQTYSFIGQESPAAKRVLAALKSRYGINGPENVKAPVGVAHAYDLTHLLARAIDKAGSTDRRKIRDALENLGPYDGLVRRYARPFAPGQHDALSPASILFARYTASDVLVPVKAATAR